MFWSYRRSVVAGFVAALPLLDWAAPPPRSVSRAELLAVMRACGGYALGATSNNARFQAEVVLRLVHAAERVDPERRPLLIDHRAWFDAFLERTALTAASAPLAVRISNELGQDVLVDYRAEQVVEDGRSLSAIPSRGTGSRTGPCPGRAGPCRGSSCSHPTAACSRACA